MGARGPAPKRANEVKGKHRGSDPSKSITRGVLRRTDPFPPNDSWCEFAKYVYESFGSSGMVDFAQNTDWAEAWLLAENVDYYLKSSKRSAMSMAEIRQSMSALGFAEADRRRVGIELDETIKQEADKGKTGVEDAKARLKRKVA